MDSVPDFIFGIGSIIFIIALLPSIFSSGKPAATSSLVTGVVLAVFAGTYMAIGFWFAAATTAVTAVCWFILLLQRLEINGR